MRLVNGLSQHDSDELRDARKQHIRFIRTHGKRIPISDTERLFKKIDGTFHEDAVPIKIGPVLSAVRDAGIEAEVFRGVSIRASAVCGISAWGIAAKNPQAAGWLGFMADPLEPRRAIFAAGLADV